MARAACRACCLNNPARRLPAAAAGTPRGRGPRSADLRLMVSSLDGRRELAHAGDGQGGDGGSGCNGGVVGAWAVRGWQAEGVAGWRKEQGGGP